jgi:hypothetical protein
MSGTPKVEAEKVSLSWILTGLGLTCAVVAALGTLMMINDARGSGPFNVLHLWPLTPFLGFIALGMFCVRRVVAAGVNLLCIVAAGALGLLVYYDSLYNYVRPDPQSGLVFLIIPVLQWLACAVSGVVALVSFIVTLALKSARPS